METHLRSILKAVSWRAGGTIVTFLIVWIMLGNFDVAAKIGVLDTALKIGVFYVHERLWSKVKFGKLNKPEYEI